MIMKRMLMPKPQNFRKQNELYTTAQLSITEAPSSSQFVKFQRVFDTSLDTEVWLAATILLQIGKRTDKEDLDFLAYLNSFSHSKQHLKWFYLDKREGLFLLMLFYIPSNRGHAVSLWVWRQQDLNLRLIQKAWMWKMAHSFTKLFKTISERCHVLWSIKYRCHKDLFLVFLTISFSSRVSANTNEGRKNNSGSSIKSKCGWQKWDLTRRSES